LLLLSLILQELLLVFSGLYQCEFAILNIDLASELFLDLDRLLRIESSVVQELIQETTTFELNQTNIF